MSCPLCNDTGSLSRDLHGYLDCARCGVADERAALEAWARKQGMRCDVADLWRVYQHGKQAASPA